MIILCLFKNVTKCLKMSQNAYTLLKKTIFWKWSFNPCYSSNLCLIHFSFILFRKVPNIVPRGDGVFQGIKIDNCKNAYISVSWNGKIKCNCEKRILTKPFEAKVWEKEYNIIIDKYGENSDIIDKFLKQKFSSSAMNVCKTQPLNKMKVNPIHLQNSGKIIPIW